MSQYSEENFFGQAKAAIWSGVGAKVTSQSGLNSAVSATAEKHGLDAASLGTGVQSVTGSSDTSGSSSTSSSDKATEGVTNSASISGSNTSGSGSNLFLADIRVYMAGILVPVHSAEISYVIEKPATATFTVPPYVEFFYIGRKDRLPVHIFVRETTVGANSFIMLFEGFVTGRTYVSSSVQRQVQFEALSYVALLNDIKFDVLKDLNDALLTNVAGHSGDSVKLTNFLNTSELISFLFNGMEIKDDNTISYPTQYLENMLTFVYQLNDNKDDNNGLNKWNQTPLALFFGRMARGLKLNQRYAKLPYFDYKHYTEPKEAAKDSEGSKKSGKDSDKKSNNTNTAGNKDSSSKSSRSSNSSSSSSGSASSSSSSSGSSGGSGGSGEKKYASEFNPGTQTTTSNEKEKNNCIFPILEGLQKQSAAMFLCQNQYEALYQNNSIFGILSYISANMEYEFCVIDAPAVHAKGKDGDGKDRDAELVQMCLKPMLHDSPYVPKCNVLFRTQVMSITNKEVFYKVPTRVRLNVQNGAWAALLGASSDPLLSAMAQQQIYPQAVDMKDTGNGLPDSDSSSSSSSGNSGGSSSSSSSGNSGGSSSSAGNSGSSGGSSGGNGSSSSSSGNSGGSSNSSGSKKDSSKSDPKKLDAWANYASDTLLKAEKYAGEVIADINAPRWLDYVVEYVDGPDAEKEKEGLTEKQQERWNEIKGTHSIYEKFMRRQLLSHTYQTRSIQINSTFDPYVVPGFPGAAFDNADTKLCFAGYVTTVTHTFLPSEITTSVTMGYVRTVEEAANLEIPSPVSFLHEITHNAYRVGEIYKKILGTPDVSVSGAEPVSYTDLVGMLDGSKASQQTDISAAYAYQRRNIVSFDDYLAFADLKVKTSGEGPDGTNTPLILGDKLKGENSESSSSSGSSSGSSGSSNETKSGGATQEQGKKAASQGTDGKGDTQSAKGSSGKDANTTASAAVESGTKGKEKSDGTKKDSSKDDKKKDSKNSLGMETTKEEPFLEDRMPLDSFSAKHAGVMPHNDKYDKTAEEKKKKEEKEKKEKEEKEKKEKEEKGEVEEGDTKNADDKKKESSVESETVSSGSSSGSNGASTIAKNAAKKTDTGDQKSGAASTKRNESVRAILTAIAKREFVRRTYSNS